MLNEGDIICSRKLEYFDEDYVEFAYEHIKNQKHRDIFKKIFIDKTLDIVMLAQFHVDFDKKLRPVYGMPVDEVWQPINNSDLGFIEVIHPCFSIFCDIGPFYCSIRDLMDSAADNKEKREKLTELLSFATGSIEIRDSIVTDMLISQVEKELNRRKEDENVCTSK